MKILWVCNMMLPMIAKELEIQASVKEGWLSGLAHQIVMSEKEMDFHVAFPYYEAIDKITGDIHSYGFRENQTTPECYSKEAYDDLYQIVKKAKPDVIHVFGTEYPHTLMCIEIARQLKIEGRVLIGIQGVMGKIAESYMAGLPDKVIGRRTLRDILKKDSLIEQKCKFEKRAGYEAQAIKLAVNITGRTSFDKEENEKLNPNLKYFKMNETLRSEFYEGEWKLDECIPHSIFMSQGNYPLKGAHIAIEALAKLREKYPDATLNIAGDDITRYKTLKEKIKISSYGKYLRELINKNNLQDAVCFLGSCSAEKMKESYLKTHVFLCASAMENSPNSVGEAMLLGTPVVSSFVGGIKDVLEPETEGLYYTWDSTEELVTQISKVFDDEEQTLERTERAKKHAAVTHCGVSNFNRLIEIYENIG